MKKRAADSDDSDDSEYKPGPSTRKKRAPKAPKAREISNEEQAVAKIEQKSSRLLVSPKNRREGSLEGNSSSPSKAAIEAEEILAQYSPGTKRIVKVSDLKRLQATNEERRREALEKVEKQKKVIETRRNKIFSRLIDIGYSKSIIERDRYDQLKSRTRWWQLVEEPQELMEQEWARICPDLCIILDKRKEVVRSLRAQMGSSASSSPTRPKFRPAQIPEFSPHRNISSQNNRSFDGFSSKRTLLEVDNALSSNEDASNPLPIGEPSENRHSKTSAM